MALEIEKTSHNELFHVLTVVEESQRDGSVGTSTCCQALRLGHCPLISTQRKERGLVSNDDLAGWRAHHCNTGNIVKNWANSVYSAERMLTDYSCL